MRISDWSSDVCSSDLVAPGRVGFASTSAPFTDRAHAGLIVDALGLPRATRTIDVSGTRRCAISLLLDTLLAGDDALVAAGERRPAKAGRDRKSTRLNSSH